MKERIYVYYMCTQQRVFFVKERDLEDFIILFKEEKNQSKILDFGSFVIKYNTDDVKNLDKIIEDAVQTVYNWSISCIFVNYKVNEVKQVVNTNIAGPPLKDTVLSEKAPDYGYPTLITDKNNKILESGPPPD